VKKHKSDQIDLTIPLKEQETSLERRIDGSCFELFCTPAVNLFSKILDRISLSDSFYEFHVVPDRNRTTDFEVFEIESVTGYSANNSEEREFRPFYLAKDADSGVGAYYTTNRAPRMLTANGNSAKNLRTPARNFSSLLWTRTVLLIAPTCGNSASRHCARIVTCRFKWLSVSGEAISQWQ
jgi:type VI secretion system protein ImpG